MTRDRQLAELQEAMDRRISTWEDWYSFLEQQTKMAGSTLHPLLVVSTMYTMFAFMQAMRELPNEGDIKVLVRHAMNILVMQLPQQLGFQPGGEVMPMDDSRLDTDSASKDAVAELLRKLKG